MGNIWNLNKKAATRRAEHTSAQVWVLLIGQYAVDLGDDCGQLSQSEHGGHHSMIVTDLEKEQLKPVVVKPAHTEPLKNIITLQTYFAS